MKKKKALLLFVDGFGLGEKGKRSFNPIETGYFPVVQNLLRNHSPVPTDALLGVSGTPQSASGQTAILTGVNAPKAIGKHLNGFPNNELSEIIKRKNIFTILKKHGLTVTNANAYNNKFLANLSKNPHAAVEMSVSTIATLSAGIALKTEEELKKGTAVYQDLTNNILREKGQRKVPVRTPSEAGVNLANIVKKYDFTFFEYFQTDLAGHRQEFESAYRVLEELDQFLESLLKVLTMENTLFIFVSDHGNIEDLSTAGHTMNKVPVIAIGNGAEKFRKKIRGLQDITPAIEEYFLENEQTSS